MEGSTEKADAMAALERQARAPVGFVAASTGPEGGNRPPPAGQEPTAAAAANPDAIDLDADMDADWGRTYSCFDMRINSLSYYWFPWPERRPLYVHRSVSSFCFLSFLFFSFFFYPFFSHELVLLQKPKGYLFRCGFSLLLLFFLSFTIHHLCGLVLSCLVCGCGCAIPGVVHRHFNYLSIYLSIFYFSTYISDLVEWITT